MISSGLHSLRAIRLKFSRHLIEPSSEIGYLAVSIWTPVLDVRLLTPKSHLQKRKCILLATGAIPTFSLCNPQKSEA